jgi:hypothetical protein
MKQIDEKNGRSPVAQNIIKKKTCKNKHVKTGGGQRRCNLH